MGLKRACGAFLSPLRWSAERRTTTPVPSSEEGNYGADKQILSYLRLARCKAADPWLWLAGLSVCTEKEGVPLPRSGGGWEGADASAIPYKHRLAHAPGSRCFGFPGGRSGALGSWGLPQVAFGHFWRVKSATPAVAVQIKTFYKACPTEGDYKFSHAPPAGVQAVTLR